MPLHLKNSKTDSSSISLISFLFEKYYIFKFFIFERGKYRVNTFAKNAKWEFTVCDYAICHCHCQKKASYTYTCFYPKV